MNGDFAGFLRFRDERHPDRQRLDGYITKIVAEQRNIPSEFAQVIEDNFWDLIDDDRVIMAAERFTANN